MANLIACADNTWLNAATFGVADTTSASIAGTTSMTVSNAVAYSSNFAPGAVEVDGILINVSARSATTTGTFTVTLRNTTDGVDTASVQVDVTDLPALATSAEAPGSWLFFKFASAVTLVAGKNYAVGLVTSLANRVYVYRDATANNYNRLLRTTTTAAAAASDRVFIQGEYTGAGASTARTVTLDVDANTEHGALDISHDGTLVANTAANVEARFAGNVCMWADGTLNLTQTTAGRRCWFRFVTASDGQFGLRVYQGSTVTMQGVNKTYWKAKLAADAAATDTNLTLDTSVGANWKSGDEIAFASTTRTYNQCEKKAMSADGSGTGITVAALAFAHSGTAPTQGEVLNLTRSVRMDSSTGTSTYFAVRGGTIDCDWTEFTGLGSSAFAGGIYIDSSGGVRNVDLKYCIFRDLHASNGNAINVARTMVAGDVVNVEYCGTYNAYSGVTVNAQANNIFPTFNDILIILSTTSGFMSYESGITATYITVTGANSSRNFSIDKTGGTWGTIHHITAHSNSNTGIYITGIAAPTITHLTAWRNNNGAGVAIFGTADGITTVENVTAFGNAIVNLQIAATGKYVLDGITLNSEAAFTTTAGLAMTSGEYDIYNLTIGNLTAHTNDFSISANAHTKVRVYGFTPTAATTVASQSSLQPMSSIRSAKHGGVAGAYKAWFKWGNVESDTVVFKTDSPSELLTPSDTTYRLESASKYVAVNSGQTATVSAWVRKTAAYDGAQPRLIVKRNDAAGITADTVLDTMTAAVETWEQLSGTTGAATENCVLEFVTDCIKGTGGAVNVDDYEVTLS